MLTAPEGFVSQNEELRREIRAMVRGAYDLQGIRIQMGLRVVANFKAKLGQHPSMKEDELEIDAQKIITDLRSSYDRITDGVIGTRINVGKINTKLKEPNEKGEVELISNYSEYCLVKMYIQNLQSEEEAFKAIGKVVAEHPIWIHFLKDVKGCGPALAAVIISEIDISKARYPSSLVMYAGIDVARDGQGRSRRAEHQIKRSYTNAKGEEKERNSITFNPLLKDKLVGVLSGSFLKVGREERYAKIYYDYKHRLENHVNHVNKTPGHRHAMALRYIIRIFLYDMYNAWRPLEGLEVAPTYQEAKLGHTHRPYND